MKVREQFTELLQSNYFSLKVLFLLTSFSPLMLYSISQFPLWIIIKVFLIRSRLMDARDVPYAAHLSPSLRQFTRHHGIVIPLSIKSTDRDPEMNRK